MAIDILDAADSDEVVNMAVDDRPKRTYEIDFNLPDETKGSKKFSLGLQLTGFVEHDGERSESFIMEFNVLDSDCPGVKEGSSLTHFIRRDGPKAYLKNRAADIRDAIGGTLGKSRSESFSVKHRVMELLQKTGEETLEDDNVCMLLEITRENYVRGKKSEKAGEPGYKISYVWTALEV